jgi:hypothetical protein
MKFHPAWPLYCVDERMGSFCKLLCNSRVSLCAPALREPDRKSAILRIVYGIRNKAISSSLVTIRGRPRTWNGGSSGVHTY